MGCDYPLKAFRPAGGGKLVFNGKNAIQNTGALQVPCGNCTGCKLEYSRQWMVRMVNESSMWPTNCFVTLTIEPEKLLPDNSLRLRSLQLFVMRLRKAIYPHRIRFYGSGEYGEQSGRAHYHAIIFNWEPRDQVHYFKTKRGDVICTSKFLDDVWSYGQTTVTGVTPSSCAYVARYAVKKIKGNNQYQKDRYRRVSPIDGKMYDVLPEFGTMSVKPGIGHDWAVKFKADYYPKGFVTIDGKKQAAPKYYLDMLTEEEQQTVKFNRLRQKVQPRSERTMERKVAREGVRNARIKPLKRGL